MPYFYIVAESGENTVVTEYKPSAERAEAYQSEAALEREFIELLREQSYEYIADEREKKLKRIIDEEGLKEEETRKFITNAFRDGQVKTTGTDIDKILPPTSRFGGGNRSEKKQTVIGKIISFFERFFGIGG